MRILYFVHLFWPNIGGIETLSMNTLPLLQQKGHDCIVVTSTSTRAIEPKDSYKGIPLHRLPMIDVLRQQDIRQFLSIRRKLSEILQDFQPDLVHVHFGGVPVSIFLPDMTDNHQASTLVTLHAGIAGMKTGPDTLLGKLLSCSTRVIAVSDAVKESALAVMPALEEKISRIYNGIPLPKIMPAKLDFLTPRFLCIGRMVEEKGFDVMIDAFKSIHQAYPKAQLFLAGDGPVRKDLEKRTAEYGLEDKIHFLGWIFPDEIPSLINRSEVVVVPSRWQEPFGLVAIEAALMRRPVIAARVGGLKEIIQNHVTGILFERENVVELAQALSLVLSNPTLGEDLGRAAQQHAVEQFSMERYVEQYDMLYNALIEEQK